MQISKSGDLRLLLTDLGAAEPYNISFNRDTVDTEMSY